MLAGDTLYFTVKTSTGTSIRLSSQKRLELAQKEAEADELRKVINGNITKKWLER